MLGNTSIFTSIDNTLKMEIENRIADMNNLTQRINERAKKLTDTEENDIANFVKEFEKDINALDMQNQEEIDKVKEDLDNQYKKLRDTLSEENAKNLDEEYKNLMEKLNRDAKQDETEKITNIREKLKVLDSKNMTDSAFNFATKLLKISIDAVIDDALRNSLLIELDDVISRKNGTQIDNNIISAVNKADVTRRLKDTFNVMKSNEDVGKLFKAIYDGTFSTGDYTNGILKLSEHLKANYDGEVLNNLSNELIKYLTQIVQEEQNSKNC